MNLVFVWDIMKNLHPAIPSIPEIKRFSLPGFQAPLKVALVVNITHVLNVTLALCIPLFSATQAKGFRSM